MKETLTREKKIQSLARVGIIVFVIALMCFMVMRYVPDIVDLLKSGDQGAMQAYISGAGKTGIVILVLLQVVQTVTIFFPGIPIYMCAGLVYGKAFGTIICYVTYVVSNCAVYLCARRMKESAETLFNNKKNSKVEELVEKAGHPMLMIAILCVFPVVPNGIIPYIAAKAKISFRHFLCAVSVGCIPGIFLFVCCGDLLTAGGSGWLSGLMVVVIVLALIGLACKDKIANSFEQVVKLKYIKQND